MRYLAAIVSFVLSLGLICLAWLEMIVRGGTCGESEGGGSCAPGVWAISIWSGALLFLILSIFVLRTAEHRRISRLTSPQLDNPAGR
jgi:hypothetical protein